MSHPNGHIVIVELQHEGKKRGWDIEEILVCYRVFLSLSELLLKTLDEREISWSQALHLVDTANLSEFYTSVQSSQRAETARKAYKQTLAEIQTFVYSLRRFILDELPKKYSQLLFTTDPPQVKMLPDKEAALELIERLSDRLDAEIVDHLCFLLDLLDEENFFLPPRMIKDRITKVGHMIHIAVVERILEQEEADILIQPLQRLGKEMKSRIRVQSAFATNKQR